MKDNIIEVGKYTIIETEGEYIVKDGNGNIIGICESEPEAYILISDNEK